MQHVDNKNPGTPGNLQDPKNTVNAGQEKHQQEKQQQEKQQQNRQPDGRTQQLAGLVQERYTLSREATEEQVKKFFSKSNY